MVRKLAISANKFVPLLFYHLAPSHASLEHFFPEIDIC